MSKKQRTLGVDEQIKKNLKEPERYGFGVIEDRSGTIAHHAVTNSNLEPMGVSAEALFHMTDASLVGRAIFYEREALFARWEQAREEAKAEVARTKAEITRRRNKMYSAAVEQAFELEEHKQTVAANDAEANWQRATRKEAA